MRRSLADTHGDENEAVARLIIDEPPKRSWLSDDSQTPRRPSRITHNTHSATTNDEHTKNATDSDDHRHDTTRSPQRTSQTARRC